MRRVTQTGDGNITNNTSDIHSELQAVNQKIAELDQDREKLVIKRDALLQKPPLKVSGVRQYAIQQASTLLAVSEKVALFKSLFKGRTELFARRWENSKGRSGYSVACNNEWVKGVCNKPRIKCNECPSREYTAVGDQVIYDHLAGKQVVGLYPLLSDNSCYLLAADFDKDGWQDAVKAMAQACLKLNIPHAVEISRSGNGAHVWIFFSEPVPARDARLLGFGLLDKAMEAYPSLSFDSYDRLFPNQDIMPDGGFGNLIALPLQHQARQKGYCQFVDENLRPFSDQWLFLSEIKTLSRKQLNDLLAQFKPKSQQAIEIRMPWEQGAVVKPEKIEHCPQQITLTLANHIYIQLDDIPPPLAARFKRLASFSNPVFFKTQAMRFSTHGIPRYISCARIEQGPQSQKWLSLPRGCFDDVIALMKEQGIKAAIDDKRVSGEKLRSLKFIGKLRKDQSKAVGAIFKHDTGILHAPTAFGKTVVAIGIINKRKVNTLILTHSLQLLDQWQERLKFFLNDIDIGVVGGGKKKTTGLIDIATYQSLINKKENTIDSLVQNYGQIIVDECHHISAPRFEMVLNEVRAKYVLGLTATPDRQDGHQKIIFMLAGPIRHKAKSNHAEKFEQQVVVTQLYNQVPDYLTNPQKRPRISDAYHWIMEDDGRTKRIVDDVLASIADGKHPLVLTERREHAEIINQLLIEKDIFSVVLRGAMRAKERKQANEQLVDAQVIVATGKYIGEGFDLPRLDTLFLSMPIAWKGLLTQYAGRIHRESEGKDCVTIFDYVDSSLPTLERMFRKREKGYKAMGYQISYAGEDVASRQSGD